MAVSEQFSLRWNNFHSNLSSGFNNLLQSEQLVDVTLVAEGKLIKAHQVVLSVCSPFFQRVFQINPCPHPIVILTIGYRELRDILIFIYQGEVKVRKEELHGFLKAAELLQIKGLSGDKDETQEPDILENQNIPKLSNDEFTDFKNVPEPNNETDRFPLGSKSSSPLPNFLSAKRKKHSSILKRPGSPIRENHLPKIQPNNLNTKSEFRGKTPPIKSRNKSMNSPKDDKVSTESPPMTSDTNDDTIEPEHIKTEPEIEDFTNSTIASQENLSFADNGRSSNKKPSYQCEACNKTFTRRDHLKTHHKNIHGEDQGPFTCYICSQLYKNSESLRKHMSKFHVIKVEVLPSIGEMCV